MELHICTETFSVENVHLGTVRKTHFSARLAIAAYRVVGKAGPEYHTITPEQKSNAKII